jgi:membrane fusion protein, protease secretion system
MRYQDIARNDTQRTETYYVRLGWLIVVLGFGGFLLWAFNAPLDQGIPAVGTVITSGQRQVIQAPLSGVVEVILVQDGDQVQAGQILAKMNNLQASSQANGAKEAIVSKERQASFMLEQLTGMRNLAKDGYIAKNRLLELERNYTQLTESITQERGKYAAYQFELENTVIKSPVDGSIVNLEVFTKGAIAQAGSKIMEVEPNNLPLLVETRVPVHLIDKVRVGLPVEILFPAFNQRTTPNIPGEVMVVPNNSTVDQKKGDSFYKVQVRVTESGNRLLTQNKIRPGMVAEVFIVTGERSLMSYLLKPLLDRTHRALREE